MRCLPTTPSAVEHVEHTQDDEEVYHAADGDSVSARWSPSPSIFPTQEGSDYEDADRDAGRGDSVNSHLPTQENGDVEEAEATGC